MASKLNEVFEFLLSLHPIRKTFRQRYTATVNTCLSNTNQKLCYIKRKEVSKHESVCHSFSKLGISSSFLLQQQTKKVLIFNNIYESICNCTHWTNIPFNFFPVFFFCLFFMLVFVFGILARVSVYLFILLVAGGLFG